jgi:hypothetical protein
MGCTIRFSTLMRLFSSRFTLSSLEMRTKPPVTVRGWGVDDNSMTSPLGKVYFVGYRRSNFQDKRYSIIDHVAIFRRGNSNNNNNNNNKGSYVRSYHNGGAYGGARSIRKMTQQRCLCRLDEDHCFWRRSCILKRRTFLPC